MPEPEKLTEARPVEPVVVAVIGGGDTRLPSGTVAETPGAHAPNLIVKVVTPIMAIMIRFANLYVASLVGFLTLKMVPAGDNMIFQAIQAADFYQLVITGAGVAIVPAGYGFIKDCGTILTGLEKKYPLATGSV